MDEPNEQQAGGAAGIATSTQGRNAAGKTGAGTERELGLIPLDPLQQLLSARDSARQRRSRSADGRYATGCFGRQRAPSLQQSQQAALAAEAAPQLRRSSSTRTLQQLTDTAYAQSRQRQRETFDFASTRRRFMQHENDEISLQAMPRRSRAAAPAPAAASSSAQRDAEGGEYITIQVNGEGVDLNE